MLRGEGLTAVDTPLKDIVARLWPLHRTLVSDGTDRALEILADELTDVAEVSIHTYPPGKDVWGWTVPERYIVHEAYLAHADGTRIVDFADNALHLVSYSVPVDKIVSWNELEPHLHFSDRRPDAIPWEFKFYDRDWGFCLSKATFAALPRDGEYRVLIRSEFVTDPDRGLRVGTVVVHPAEGPAVGAGELLVLAHICHPHQANDDAAGVASAIATIRRLTETALPRGSMSVRFLFCPETIGSICYLSDNEELIPTLKGAVFLEMTGNRNTLVLQHSRQGDHLIDRIARRVLAHRSEPFREGAFREVVGNDEMVVNGPGVNIPCISLSRWPYDEYHTSDDTPDLLDEDMLAEAADVAEEIIRIFASNFVPLRTFRGPLFLSGHGLWVDWRVDRSLNLAVEKITLRLEGDRSLFDISAELELDYWVVRDYVGRFADAGLVERLPIPFVGDTA